MCVKSYTCRRCGIEFRVTYRSEESAKKGRRQYCPKCKAIVEKKNNRKGYEQQKLRSGTVSKIPSQNVSRACDRFFESRGIKSDEIEHNLFLSSEARSDARKQDVIDAVNYGASAYQRYKNLTRKQAKSDEQK